MIRLSKSSKMPCFSWSLQAIETCPASRKKNGQLVDACKGCYADGGFYLMNNVKELRAHNKKDWKRANFVSDMVSVLDNYRYFRWFDSGDVYHPALALKILEIAKLTPWCKHWLPTRMHKFPKFRKIFQRMNNLDNFSVRFSSDSITGGTVRGKNTSTIIETDQDAPKNAVMCDAYKRGGKCGSCRACWNKDISVIAYPAHGRKMKKVYQTIKLLNVA